MIENIFSIPVWTHNINITEEHVNYCLNKELNETGVIKSNHGGWQSDYLNTVDFNNLESLFTQLNAKIFETAQSIDTRVKLNIQDAWININRKHHYNEYHIHPLCTLSAVVYLKCNKDSGGIVFNSNSSRQHYPLKEYSSMLFQEYKKIEPEIGKLIIFPAWLNHKVLPNLSETERISIAFNILQESLL